MALASPDKNDKLKKESHSWQRRNFWPKEGQHILAQFDDDSVVVYQAFRPSIAEYAVKNQRFGGDEFSFERMSWIKPNFLWMMYRSGWAQKPNQQCILAVRITREGFDTILANAYTAKFQKSKKLTNDNIMVRLQWDPDHGPRGDKLTRRAIQLGLKGDILKMYATQWVVHIEDVTPFVKEQYKVLCKDGEEALVTPSERVYPITDTNISTQIELDFYDQHYEPPVVKHPAGSNQQHVLYGAEATTHNQHGQNDESSNGVSIN